MKAPEKLYRDLNLMDDICANKNNPGREFPVADYQLAHLDLSTLIELVSQLLDPGCPWGLVTELSK